MKQQRWTSQSIYTPMGQSQHNDIQTTSMTADKLQVNCHSEPIVNA